MGTLPCLSATSKVDNFRDFLFLSLETSSSAPFWKGFSVLGFTWKEFSPRNLTVIELGVKNLKKAQLLSLKLYIFTLIVFITENYATVSDSLSYKQEL